MLNQNNQVLEKETENHLQEPDAENTDSESQTLEAKIAELKDQLLRTLAESENLRKRTQKEKEDAFKYAVTNFAREILSVADNFDRALMALENKEIAEDIKAFVEGIQMTQSQLSQIFEKFGIVKIQAQDVPFDSSIHQAVFEVEDGSKEVGMVAQVVQPGYMIQDRLLRPAMVGVVKAKS